MNNNKNRLIIHTDGGARGNPGPAAIGVVIKTEDGSPIVKLKRKIGVTTNNIAEYNAVLEALIWVKKHKTNIEEAKSQLSAINFFLDSQLVVNQLTGNFKIKNHGLKIIHQKVKLIEQELKAQIFYHAIPREQNKEADRLVNLAFDENNQLKVYTHLTPV